MGISILETGMETWPGGRKKQQGADGASRGGRGMHLFRGHSGGGSGSSLTEPEGVKRGFSMNL